MIVDWRRCRYRFMHRFNAYNARDLSAARGPNQRDSLSGGDGEVVVIAHHAV
jgi:hypothetical protein